MSTCFKLSIGFVPTVIVTIPIVWVMLKVVTLWKVVILQFNLLLWKELITELQHCCFYREGGKNEIYDAFGCIPFIVSSKANVFFMISQIMEKTIHQSRFQICQYDSKFHFFKDFYVKKIDFLKLKILSKWQLSILEDKTVCQSNKYYYDNILTSLCNTLRCITNSNTCCWKYLPIHINKCCIITLTVFQLMTPWLKIIFHVQFINCLYCYFNSFDNWSKWSIEKFL